MYYPHILSRRMVLGAWIEYRRVEANMCCVDNMYKIGCVSIRNISVEMNKKLDKNLPNCLTAMLFRIFVLVYFQRAIGLRM